MVEKEIVPPEDNATMDDARAALYAQFEGKASEPPVIEENPVEPPNPKPDAPADIKEPTGPVPDKKEDAPPAAKGDSEKEPEEKKVALSALHEERSKRKMLAEQLKLKEEKERAYLDQIREYGIRLESLEKKKIQEEPIDDIEAALKVQKEENLRLQKRIDAVESHQATKAKMEAMEIARSKEQELLKQVEEVDQALSAEGFPGFKNLSSEVAREVMAKIQEDDTNRAVYANPDGWKKLYKDVVYPRVKASIVTSDKISKKEELKSRANLIDKPGGAPVSKKADEEDEDTSYESYMKMRQKISA